MSARQQETAPRRLLWDCSHLAAHPHLNTGIERVARELGTALLAVGPERGFEVVPCVTDGTSRIHRIDIPRVSDRPPAPRQSVVVPSPDDIWMLADHAWDPARLIGISPWWREGMRIVLFQYDLTPIRQPETTTPLTAALFSQWLYEAAAFADAYVSISHATKAALVESLRTMAPWRSFDERQLPVVHLASTWPRDPAGEPTAPGNYRRMLAVGTIEPRKRYDLLVDVFEEHWRQGGRCELHIVGRKGWNSGSLQKRLTRLGDTEPRFAWRPDAGDAELQEEYREAGALVSLSSEEGFGLPVIEAAAVGLPLILSDIAVFREISDGEARFVPTAPDEARRGLLTLLAEIDAGTVHLPTPSPRLATRTWAQAAEEVLEAVAALPPPNAQLRTRWDQRAALALAALHHREAPTAEGPDLAPPRRVDSGPRATGPRAGQLAGPRAAGPDGRRRRLAEYSSRMRLKVPMAAVRVMHLRNQAFRLCQQLDARTSVLEARVAALAKVYPTANALQEVRAAEADRLLRYQLDAILIDVEKLMEELSGAGADGGREGDADHVGRVARLRERLRARDHG